MASVIRAVTVLAFCLAGCEDARDQANAPNPFDRFSDTQNSSGQETVHEGKAEIVTKANVTLTFRRCRRSSDTCVVDGDTIRLASEKIRVADIDTPEVRTPSCASEKILGEKATDRLIVLLNEGPFEVVKVGDRDEDRYGRKLRILVRDGHSLGDQLVSEGLARTWSGAREPWC